jgi:hypothetical protein
MPDILYLQADNDFHVSITLTDEDGDPVVGLTPDAFISATKDRSTASAIHGDLTPTMSATDAQGLSTGTIQGSAITARLIPAYVNEAVYLIRKSGTDYFSYRTCFVKDHRRAD